MFVIERQVIELAYHDVLVWHVTRNSTEDFYGEKRVWKYKTDQFSAYPSVNTLGIHYEYYSIQENEWHKILWDF